MPVILAIDQSTSATKAILFSDTGKVLDKEAREHRQIYPQPGWLEHDAEEIWQNVLAVIRELAARNPDKIGPLAGLSITNQRETIVMFERSTGRPVHSAIVWQCRRSEEICAHLREQGLDEMVRAKTGLKIDTYFSASKLQWLLANKTELAAGVASGDVIIGTIDTYLIYRLTQGAVFATDYSNASRTLLFNIGSLQWDLDLCQLFDVPVTALAEVRESQAVFGETNVEGILPTRVPIAGVMGDSQAALFAQKCFAPGMIKATLGTGTSILLNIGNVFQKPVAGAVTALAWVANGQPTYAVEGIINFSAATIEWLKNQLGLIENSADTGALASAVPDNGGVYLVPAFAGLSAPYWAPEARAAIVGMTAHTRREHIVRAALEAIAYQIRDVLDMLRRDASVQFKTIRADGGPTRNDFLMQFIADIAGVNIEVAEIPEASAWGAALNGLLGTGHYKSLTEVAASAQAGKTFYPAMNPDLVQKNYHGWQAAVKRIL